MPSAIEAAHLSWRCLHPVLTPSEYRTPRRVGLDCPQQRYPAQHPSPGSTNTCAHRSRPSQQSSMAGAGPGTDTWARGEASSELKLQSLDLPSEILGDTEGVLVARNDLRRDHHHQFGPISLPGRLPK